MSTTSSSVLTHTPFKQDLLLLGLQLVHCLHKSILTLSTPSQFSTEKKVFVPTVLAFGIINALYPATRWILAVIEFEPSAQLSMAGRC